ncbi:hypothetical protein GZH47_08940 [Paenibacillus rhizovicinus]|uniref:ABC transporter substrate-binding protein n=1 Tax=Paenibacillus rhizovicinus TaxID=2704463 RepID=A0A6C0NXJ2_9BACL|nr:hypothetical protein [Paenibacillus rhizovicinus]QHW30965.1 hypothetical protein GZH47_08940 [Paenibacillus rhizovicinus]
MKTWFVPLLMLVVVLALSACGNNANNNRSAGNANAGDDPASVNRLVWS